MVGEAEVVDVVEVVVVALVVVQLMPSDNSRASLPFNPQPTTRSRSACVRDMLYTGAPVNGRKNARQKMNERKTRNPLRAARLHPNKRFEVRLGHSQ